ncbi:hypothetical protein [Wolbachia endosymbiont of Litomosoides brasiliensis]|nr:hypothetical protein [Wolbachia endosymbiont of Litomosoides brasiliensis]
MTKKTSRVLMLIPTAQGTVDDNKKSHAAVSKVVRFNGIEIKIIG